MIDTVIFDVGGTLLGAPDLFSELSNVFNEIQDKKSIYEQIKSLVMNGIINATINFNCIEDIIRYALSNVSATLGLSDKGIYAKDIYHYVFVEKSYLYEDTISTLQVLMAKGIRMIVASDADSELLYEEFRNFKLEKYFSKYFISSELGAYKPNIKFVEAIKPLVLGLEDKTIIVGDSGVDIQTGKALGIKTVLKGEQIPLGAFPDYHIKNLAEIIEIL